LTDYELAFAEQWRKEKKKDRRNSEIRTRKIKTKSLIKN
jgi:hypothetical protein